MGRRSRKDILRAVGTGKTIPPAESTPANDLPMIFETGGYARLSVFETRDRKNSEALHNQKELISRFISGRNDLHFRNMYEDNGETGTNFDREGFRQLIADVRARRINCIVVKDLSRFGRDYIEAGSYLEQIFPFLGVRFISINDGYDSVDALTHDILRVALKNLVNQMYSMDISRKSGSVLRQMQKRGKFIGAFAAYGYLKDPNDSHHIIADPETAPVVQEIFRRRAAGESIVAITRRLNECDIPSPFAYRRRIGMINSESFADEKPWPQQTVKYILKNEMYLGHMVQGRQISEFYAGRPDHALPREQWTVVRNTHEPLVSEELFSKVQYLMDEKKRAYHGNLGKYDDFGKSENVLKGLVFCADCGRSMVRYKQVGGQKIKYYFMCPNYAAQLYKSGCVYKFLSEDELITAIRLLLEQEIKLAADAAALINNREALPVPDRAAALKAADTDRARLGTLRHRLMQDYLSGNIGETDYKQKKERYRRETALLEELIKKYSAEIGKQDRVFSDESPRITALSALLAVDKMTRQMIGSLIERITVYSNERIEVCFCFRDERRELLESIRSRAVKTV